MGARDLDAGRVELARRDTREKSADEDEGIELYIKEWLAQIQDNIYQKALTLRDSKVRKCDSWDEFKEEINKG